MKIVPPPTRLLRYVVALLAILLFAGLVPRAEAINVSEGTSPVDFPNVTPDPPYTLPTVGVHTFHGTVSGSDNQDRFTITIPAGLKLSEVTKNFTGASNSTLFVKLAFFPENTGYGSNSFNLASPLPAGNYDVLVNANSGTGSVWTVYFYVTAAPDYAISTGGNFSITDVTGQSDTLTLYEPGPSSFAFSAPGRWFSVNGGQPTLDDSGNFGHGGVFNFTINAGAGDNVIAINNSSYPVWPNIIINGGSGNDTVQLNGDINFAPNNGLNVNLQDDDPSPGVDRVIVAANANIIATGVGGITINCSRSVAMGAGSSLEVQNGNLQVSANTQGIPTTGNFIGVNLGGGTLKSTGSGFVIVTGRGGNDAGGYQIGVQLYNGGKILGGTNNNVQVIGTGGGSSGIVNRGVTVSDSGSIITSSGANVLVIGNGGTNSSGYGIGVSLLNGGQIGAGGAGLTSVAGHGAGTAGSYSDQGVEMGGAGSRIFSSGGSVGVTGEPGPGPSYGAFVDNFATITTPAAGGSIQFLCDSFNLTSTASVVTTNTASFVRLSPLNAVNPIDVGGPDGIGLLGLSDAELDRVSTANLYIGNGSSPITITAPITHPTATNFSFYPGPVGLRATYAGTDVALTGSGTVGVHNGPLVCTVDGNSPDVNYSQLKVAGKLDLTDASLAVEGSYSRPVGQSFTIADNDGSDPVIGAFTGVPEGAGVWINGAPARISYHGGSGNDVTLTRVAQSLFPVPGKTNGNWRFAGLTSTNGILTVQATTNFVLWTNIGFATGDLSGRFNFTDTNFSKFRYRYYRTTN